MILFLQLSGLTLSFQPNKSKRPSIRKNHCLRPDATLSQKHCTYFGDDFLDDVVIWLRVLKQKFVGFWGNVQGEGENEFFLRSQVFLQL